MHESIKIAMHAPGRLFGGPDEVVSRIAASPEKRAFFTTFCATLKQASAGGAAGLGALLGGASGATLGAYDAGEGNRLQGALRGGAAGAAVGGLGGAALHGHVQNLTDLARKFEEPPPGFLQDYANAMKTRAQRMGDAGLAVGVPLAAGAAGYAAAPSSEKTADIGQMLGRALGGAAIGGGLGAGAGALAAHMRGDDPKKSAIKGGLGGAVIGGGLGGLSSGHPGLHDKALGAGVMGVGAFGGNKLLGALTGDSEAKEQRDREIGKFDAMQEIKMKQRVALEPMHHQAFQFAQQDDIINRADPAMIQSAFDTMKRFAPNLAADPNAVRSFLRESATWGTGPSYAMLKNLTDAESSVARAGGAL